jgi:hypothetical protein
MTSDSIEQPHEYLGSTKGFCMLCLHVEKHPIHGKSPYVSPYLLRKLRTEAEVREAMERKDG